MTCFRSLVLVLAVVAASAQAGNAQSPAPPAADTAKAGRIVGVVSDIANHPLDGALITLVAGDTKASLLTGDSGRFMFTAVPTGTAILSVRRLGYRFSFTKVEVSPDEAVNGSVVMTRTTYTLDTVKVLAYRKQWEKPARLDYTTKYDDFYHRPSTSPGGRFYRHEDIQKMVNVSTASDVPSRVPHIKVTGNRGSLAVRRNGCQRMAYLLDGLPCWTPRTTWAP